jgi:hypothetical protein
MARLAKPHQARRGIHDRRLDADTRKAIDEGLAAGQRAIRAEEAKLGRWSTVGRSPATLADTEPNTCIGPRGFFAVGGNLVEDAIYPP